MKSAKSPEPVPPPIEQAIIHLRGQSVLLDRDLAVLYRVDTKTLNQAVRRNRSRFPLDFMFQLTWDEAQTVSRSQTVTLKQGKNPKYRPYGFTEQGVAMLSSVLRSNQAIEVNIAIMRAFVRLRQVIASHAGLARKLDDLEAKYDAQFRVVFDAIRALMEAPPEPAKKARIGFRDPNAPEDRRR
jgi:ORF6N domain